ncbi:hypothetical protein V502_07765 [Pseudogymnoascus sp. VKM F-4520 (FW-2644)]|nr:hypothetical protein V502_07765 [Pseudogymnoascus sp. VKM F-4520 (FW-2644)]
MTPIASEPTPSESPQVRNQAPIPTHSHPLTPPQPQPLNVWETPAFIASRRDVITGGSCGLIHLLPSGHVRKDVYPEFSDKRTIGYLELESRIYARLPRHPRLLQMIRYSSDEGLVLEYMPNGNLGCYLRGEEPRTHLQSEEWPLRGEVDITPAQRLQWACDAAEGLQVLHEHGVLHCDVRSDNFLLDEELRLKIIDFEGSSLDGGKPSALEGTRYFLRRPWKEMSTVATELFALGSTIYEIMTGKQPYVELRDEEVTALFVQKCFPPVDHLPCGDIIMKCWLSEVHSAKDAYTLIKARLQN